jgi:hypothetical protein
MICPYCAFAWKQDTSAVYTLCGQKLSQHRDRGEYPDTAASTLGEPRPARLRSKYTPTPKGIINARYS